jgi:tetratricopeptide (TPR) repeat protein
MFTTSTSGQAIAFSEKAVALWEELTSAYPNEPEYQDALGRTYCEHAHRLAWCGDREGASKCSEKALPVRERLAARYPNVPQYQEDLADSLARKARRFVKEGKSKEADANFARAFEICQKLASEYPNAHLYPTRLGDVYESLGKWDNAIAEYSKTIELRPDNIEALSKRAAAYNNLGQYHKALADYRKACELNPQDPYAAIAYAMLCLSLNMEDEYRRHRKAFLARFLGTSDPVVAERTARAFLLLPATGEDLERAAALADRSVELGRHHGFYVYFMAVKALAEYRRGRYENAIDWARKANVDGLLAAMRLVLAMAHQQLGHAEQARQLLAAALTSDEWNEVQWSPIGEPLLREAQATLKLDEATVHVQRGLVQRRRGKWPEAEAEYRKAIELDPRRADSYLGLGRAVLHRKDDDAKDQVVAAREAVELYPQMAVAHFALGQALVGQDPAAAIAAFRQATGLDPKYVLAHLKLGETLLHALRAAGKAELEEAVVAYSKVIELEPNNNGGWANRGLAYQKLGQWQKALDDYSRAIQLVPAHRFALCGRAEVYTATGQWGKAIADYDKAIDLDPKNAATRNNRGNAYFALKQYDKAIADYTEVIALDSKFAVAWSNRGGAFASLRQWDKALADFTRSLEIDPDAPLPWYNRALIHLQCGDHEGYRKDCAGMRRQFGASVNPDSVNWTAWTCTLLSDALEDWNKLVQRAEKPLAADPDNEIRLTTLGAVLYRAGRYDEAIRRLTEAEAAYKKATARTSTIAYASLFLAMAEERTGHAEQAREWHAKAVREIEQPAAERAGDPTWNRQLALRLLCSEAETLLKIDKKPEKKEP